VRLVAFWRSTIGKKAVMAATGLVLIAFLISHVASNLTVFQGPEKINAYAAFLRSLGPALWVARAILLIAAVLHIVAAVQLTRAKRVARPDGYAVYRPQISTFASRSMRVGGALLLVFIVYHLLHFTTGTVHPDFRPGDVHWNVLRGFRVWWVSAFYLIAMIALGLHLFHGTWSSFRTLGLSRASDDPMQRRAATVLAIALWLGFSAIPLAVLAGVLR
jgi:succinate dehydrogenase / fumarate reductase, cytochrome b subunit